MLTNNPPSFTPFRVSIAAEAIAAALLAQAGYDVSVQYGANQPLYDLVAVKPTRMLQISVKGSQEGGWGLTQSYKGGRTYQEAADVWLKKHGRDLVFVFVQYAGTTLGEMPRVFVARAWEVADHLKKAHLGRGDTILFEKYAWKGGTAKGHIDEIPEAWEFRQKRIDTV